MAKKSSYLGSEQHSRIEIIPMIDVMMFLLVFFVMIMLEMIQGAGITLDLPQSSTQDRIESVTLNIGVSADGGLYVDGAQMDDAQLAARLAEMQQTGKLDVVIAGDRGSQYESIVHAMDLVRGAGISAIGLATQK
ncbi:biopolymer transporter ExbD [Stutzerimonas kirkiae]|uniref:Biopolymer transporter ExbD n=1 Tax=Stutzerimonas kirkiae TaxID=2211392 RepID=A0A4Q9R051_9GAMM|nr:biopolymer transporter ExbD [Stutzerimonas kirkiae]TBU90328.1 biopolymer transporter ExbD [Stutzerimonas kirkiae]TBU97999.1 biopolymer transporter ExbD [Stutzerimonas kirkiae]TBV13190.1 biopolymer transporter ExbD [Stutzerimonas kirkiae]